jgi:uncharacterized coiled-coil DUF342 family protein
MFKTKAKKQREQIQNVLTELDYHVQQLDNIKDEVNYHRNEILDLRDEIKTIKQNSAT